MTRRPEDQRSRSSSTPETRPGTRISRYPFRFHKPRRRSSCALPPHAPVPPANPGSAETHGTISHGTRSSVELLVHVIACLAGGVGLRGPGWGFESIPKTVLGWLVKVAAYLPAFSAYGLHALHLPHQVQFAELSAVLSGGARGRDQRSRGSRTSLAVPRVAERVFAVMRGHVGTGELSPYEIIVCDDSQKTSMRPLRGATA